MAKDRAGDGADAGEYGKARDNDEERQDTKTQDLAKAGRKDFDPNAGEE